ncbi:MAG: 2-hydroxyacyl-CoA dehydratase family protein [Methanocalculaceae archaeon]|nr:2-hydroxyacyl-CoA dehydratase family protein [Methanocalculaceae archaeon]
MPPDFENFPEARKASFLKVRDLSRKHPIVGAYCTFVPCELIRAAGAVQISLCSGSDETIPAAETDLPVNFCPLVKSSYGFAKTNKCPYFHFSNLIVGETTCDGKKKMFEYLTKIKPVHVIHLPQTTDEGSIALLKTEFKKFAKQLEQTFGTTLTVDSIREQIRAVNMERLALQDVCQLAKSNPPKLSGKELFAMFNSYSTTFMHEEKLATLKNLHEAYTNRPAPDTHQKRILITGSPLTAATTKVIDDIEAAGGSVVYIEGCIGSRPNELLVDEENSDVYDALARKYIRIPCSCMTPNTERLETIGKKIEEYCVDGVVDMVLFACHTFNAESTKLREYVTIIKETPFIHIETDYSQADIGQISTRLSAFLEML